MNPMKKNLLYFLFPLLFLVSACNNKSDTPTPSQAPSPNIVSTKILPIGASRVAGNRPEYESFRYELWKLLLDDNLHFDFIGSVKDEASYPIYKNQSFDPDHEGGRGGTSEQILTALTESIDPIVSQLGTPEVVLFSTPGGNDALQKLSFENAVQNVNAIIDILQSKNPNVTIIIEQMAPPRADTESDVLDFMMQMNAEVVNIAASQSTATSKVMVIDMATGFTDALLADQVHYNEAGARFIAARYYDQIKDLIRMK
ncbi:hypothetical protein BKI52_28755 [marine bacterium AO1-C]|nr:hypothetical protein BKI52_28755 [marine bacterium AO1-C]